MVVITMMKRIRGSANGGRHECSCRGVLLRRISMMKRRRGWVVMMIVVTAEALGVVIVRVGRRRIRRRLHILNATTSRSSRR